MKIRELRTPRSATNQTRRRRLAVALAVTSAIALTAGLGASAEEESADAPQRGNRYYVGVFAAGSWATADFERSGSGTTSEDDQSFFWGASLGLERRLFGPLLIRLELEGTNERHFAFPLPGGSGNDQVEIQDWTMNGNFWIVYPLKRLFPDVPIVRRISPFGGGGVGFSRATIDVDAPGLDASEKATRFAWQGGVGVSYEVTRWLSLDARYQYADLGKTTTSIVTTPGGATDSTLVTDLGANEFLGGVRFVF